MPDLGIDVEKVIARDRNPVSSVHRYLEDHPVDLIVLAAHQRDDSARLVTRLERPTGTFTLLHVGAPGNMPAVNRPTVPGWQWEAVTKEGEVIESIIDTAVTTKADLTVMTTDGRNGFLDALRGSHSERILRRTPCPLLAIPEPTSADEADSAD